MSITLALSLPLQICIRIRWRVVWLELAASDLVLAHTPWIANDGNWNGHHLIAEWNGSSLKCFSVTATTTTVNSNHWSLPGESIWNIAIKSCAFYVLMNRIHKCITQAIRIDDQLLLACGRYPFMSCDSSVSIVSLVVYWNESMEFMRYAYLFKQHINAHTYVYTHIASNDVACSRQARERESEIAIVIYGKQVDICRLDENHRFP